jgi:hypothetical protein
MYVHSSDVDIEARRQQTTEQRLSNKCPWRKSFIASKSSGV